MKILVVVNSRFLKFFFSLKKIEVDMTRELLNIFILSKKLEVCILCATDNVVYDKLLSFFIFKFLIYIFLCFIKCCSSL